MTQWRFADNIFEVIATNARSGRNRKMPHTVAPSIGDCYIPLWWFSVHHTLPWSIEFALVAERNLHNERFELDSCEFRRYLHIYRAREMDPPFSNMIATIADFSWRAGETRKVMTGVRQNVSIEHIHNPVRGLPCSLSRAFICLTNSHFPLQRNKNKGLIRSNSIGITDQ
jgi:hypothetical protein